MNKRGFTLIELMVVIVILGILAAVAIPFYNNYVHKSRSAEATVNINGIRTLEESWFAENNTYCDSVGDCNPSVVGNQTCCVAAPAGAPGNQTRNWTAVELTDPAVGWSVIGFAPSGASTYYTYGVNSGCPATVVGGCTARLTIGAEGDLDSDGSRHTFALATGTGAVIDPTAGFTTNITPAAFGTIVDGGAGVF